MMPHFKGAAESRMARLEEKRQASSAGQRHTLGEPCEPNACLQCPQLLQSLIVVCCSCAMAHSILVLCTLTDFFLRLREYMVSLIITWIAEGAPCADSSGVT